MRIRGLKAALLLSSAAFLSGCSGLGGPYVPSFRAEKIAAMDVPGDLAASIELPVPLGADELAAMGKDTLASYVAHTLAESPIVRQGYYGLLSGIASADQTSAVRGPTLGVDAHWGGTDSGGAENVRRDSALGAFGSMTIFDGGAGRLREDRARWTAVSTAASAQDRVESVAFAVVDAYIGVLRSRAVLRLAEDEVSRFEVLLREVRRMVSDGGANVSDGPEAESRVERIRQQKTQARQALSDADAKFQRLVGDMPAVPAMRRPPEITAPSEAEAVAGAPGHPQVKAYDAQIRAAIKSALSVDAERTGSLVAQFGPSGFMQIFRGANVTALGTAFLHLTLPIFDSGERSYRLKRAAADLEVSIAQRADAVRAVEFAIKQASNARVAAIEQAILAERERAASDRLARAKAADYKAGIADLRAVLDAEEQTAGARIKSETAAWEKTLASYRLLGASGVLTEALKAVGHTKIDISLHEDMFNPPTLLNEATQTKCSFDGNESACSFK